jgi:hypothetical protein
MKIVLGTAAPVRAATPSVSMMSITANRIDLDEQVIHLLINDGKGNLVSDQCAMSDAAKTQIETDVNRYLSARWGTPVTKVEPK